MGLLHEHAGDPRGPARPHRRHHGTPHRLLHPQWGRDCLLRHQTVPVSEDLENRFKEETLIVYI